MSFNESAINELALNEGLTESLVGYIGVVGSLAGVSSSPEGKICVVGMLHERDLFGKVAIQGALHQRTLEGKLALKGELHDRTLNGTVCLVGVLRELNVPIGAQGIGSSTPTGVLPQTGSAIFTRWERVSAKEILVHRHYDYHESGRVNFDDTRYGWRLEMNVSGAKQTEVAQFFVDHVWAGKAFYFYDLQANGYQYDATGVLTDGRYKVRFVGDDFPRVHMVGGRFVIPLTLIEVD